MCSTPVFTRSVRCATLSSTPDRVWITCTVKAAVWLVAVPQTCHHLTVSCLYGRSCGVGHRATDLSAPDCVLPVRSELWGWSPRHRPVGTWLCLTCTVGAVGLVTTPQTCQHLCLPCAVGAVRLVITLTPDCVLPVQSELWGCSPHHRHVSTWLSYLYSQSCGGGDCFYTWLSYLYSQNCEGGDCLNTWLSYLYSQSCEGGDCFNTCLTCTVRAVGVVIVSIPNCLYLHSQSCEGGDCFNTWLRVTCTELWGWWLFQQLTVVLPVQSELWGWSLHHRPYNTSLYLNYLYSQSCEAGECLNTWLCLTCTVRAVRQAIVSIPDCVLPVQSELWGRWLSQYLTVSYLYSQSCGDGLCAIGLSSGMIFLTCSHSQTQSH